MGHSWKLADDNTIDYQWTSGCIFLQQLIDIMCASDTGLGIITSVGEEIANLSAVFTCNYVVSVWRGFLFPGCLGWATLFYCGTP